jgi:hypothetical protein
MGGRLPIPRTIPVGTRLFGSYRFLFPQPGPGPHSPPWYNPTSTSAKPPCAWPFVSRLYRPYRTGRVGNPRSTSGARKSSWVVRHGSGKIAIRPGGGGCNYRLHTVRAEDLASRTFHAPVRTSPMPKGDTVSDFNPNEWLRADRAQSRRPTPQLALRELQVLLERICQFHGEHFDDWADLWIHLRPPVDAAGLGQRVYELQLGSATKNHINALYQRSYEGNREEVIRLLKQVVPDQAELQRAQEEMRLWQLNRGPAPALGRLNGEIRRYIRSVADEVCGTHELFEACPKAVQQQPASALPTSPRHASQPGTDQQPPIDAITVQSTPCHRLTSRQANEKAMKLAKNDPQFVNKTLREWASDIGCSPALISGLPFWRQIAERTGRSRKGRAPRVVTLTDKLLAVTPDRHAELERLTAQQRADSEPSPLDADPSDQPSRKLKARKKP